MLSKFILMQCRNCKIMWLVITEKDTISMSDGHGFSTDPLLSIIKMLSTTEVNGKCMRLPNQTRPTGKKSSWLTDGINKSIFRIPYWC